MPRTSWPTTTIRFIASGETAEMWRYSPDWL